MHMIVSSAITFICFRYPNLRQGSFDMSGNSVTVNDNLGQGGGNGGSQNIPIPEYAGENPCGTLDSYFYPFPDDPRYKI